MKLVRKIIHSYLYMPYYVRKFTATGAFGKRGARYLDAPILANGNGLKGALIRYHVKQFHESSCSVASVVSVVNALRAQSGGAMKPIDQQAILEKVRTGHWRERMGAGGHNGRRGLPLPLLGRVVASSLAVYGIDHQGVETESAPSHAARAKKVKALLWRRLAGFEERGAGLIIAHFNQGAFVPALHIPHISPVGAFDPPTGMVTILDVDPDQERPYQIDFDTFYRGLAANYNHIFRPFGYKGGGYVYIRLK